MNTADGRGRFRDFEHGYIYWTPQTGAHEVHGDIGSNGHRRFNHFEGGSIYRTSETRAYEMHGEIRDKWASVG